MYIYIYDIVTFHIKVSIVKIKHNQFRLVTKYKL